MKKPSRESVKNAAIATGLIGGIVITTGLALKLNASYFQARIDAASYQYLAALMYQDHPELVTEYAAKAEEAINAALNASK